MTDCLENILAVRGKALHVLDVEHVWESHYRESECVREKARERERVRERGDGQPVAGVRVCPRGQARVNRRPHLHVWDRLAVTSSLYQGLLHLYRIWGV